MRFERLTVNAIVDGDGFYLVDDKLRLLTKRIDTAKCTNCLEVSEAKRQRFERLWHDRQWCQQMLERLTNRLRQRLERCDPWAAKCQAMACSVRMRIRRPTPAPKTGRRNHHGYRSRTWEEAITRMRNNAKDRAFRASLDGWTKWTITVANNTNRRKGGKYDGTYWQADNRKTDQSHA